MNPTKSERKARRSSILKPPKPRQPLQNVDLAASSTENSPATTTAKIKRRVSFAEKKHVKEFCDSMEQGTVWDNTYEESESSNIKSMNNDENIIGNTGVNHELITREKSTISVVTESAITITQSVNTENTKIFADAFYSSEERDVHVKTSGIPFPANHSGSFNARRSLSVTENVFRTSTNKDKSTLAENSGACPAKTSAAMALENSANFVPPPMPNDDCNEVSMDETLIENVLAEPTAPTPLTLSKGEPLLRASFNMIPNIDFSKNDPNFGRRFSAKSKEQLIAQDKENLAIDPMELSERQKIHSKNSERIRVYHENSIEMTEAVSNRMSMVSKQEPVKLGEKESIEKAFLVAEGKTTFQMKTVETVTKIMGLSTTSLKELNRSEIDLRPDRMPILRSKSLNPSEVVQKASSAQQIQQPLSEKTTIFHDEPVDFTEAVPKIRSTEDPQEKKSERTMVFHDTSLEFTEAVQNVPNADQLQKLAPERTTIFHDESVNRTESHNLSTVGKPQWALQERTTTVHDKSLDFNDVVRNDLNKENSRKPAPEKTSIFYNQPVDMTEVVRSRLSCAKPPEEKTTIFYNQPVEMTEVVRSCEKLPEERTTIFHNQPVDMTEVVRSRSSCEKLPEEKTTIFHNQPVDMTEVVRGRSNFEKPPLEKTTIFDNVPVDMTEAVRTLASFETQLPEKTTIFNNVSVDMTEAVRPHPSFKKQPPEKTTIFDNVSVDMTEAVRPHPSFEKLHPEKTTIFNNVSVDMTEVVRPHPSFEKLPSEKTTIFNNVSVDMTEAVRPHPSFEKLPPEKMTIFDNVSVDMTEAARPRPSYGKWPAEKTTIFHNQPVDTTEVVRGHSSYVQPPPEKTAIFSNDPVDMTEMVRGRSSFEKLPPEKTTIFQNQSVDMTEVVRSGTSYEKVPPEKQTAFHNQSVDTTEVGVTKPAVDKSLISIPVRTTMLHDKSMDMPETMLSDVNIQNPTQQVFEHEILPENQSPEPTESVSRVSYVPTSLSRDSCTPAVKQITQQEPLDAEEANRLFATIEMKIPDPETQSPVAKRMKSLGTRKSIDFTAAIPFIAYRKLARKKCNEINTEDREQHSEDVNFRASSNSEVLGNKLMDMSEESVDSSAVGPLRTHPTRSVEIVPREAQDKNTNFQDNSMQMTEGISRLNSYEPMAQKYIDSQGDAVSHDDSMEMTRAIPGILKATSTIFHDQSMELTRAVPHYPTTGNLPVADENSAGGVNRRISTLPNSHGETLFRDDAMELTRAVQFPSQATEGNRIVLQEAVNPWSKNMAQLEQDGKTMVYCDDSMEITRAVTFPSQNQNEAVNKENDPIAIKHLHPHSFRRSESESRIGISKNELLEIMESVPFLSSQKNKENRVSLTEMEELRRDTESEEITGVVPFATQNEDDNEDSSVSERVVSSLGAESERMEMTEGVRSSSNTKTERSECVPDDRHSRLPEMEAFSPMEIIQTRHSHVAKELFQKPVTSEKTKAANKSAAIGSETADLQAEIRKLAETFALSNSVEESGFDQATFLQQQARCMEDFEANSTASQEYHSTSARENALYAEKRDSPDPGRVGSPENSAGTPEPALPTANWAVSSGSNSNRSTRNFSSGMDRGQYDKSLEELRCRAYSVSKFRPEVTGFELTAAISMADLGKHYESIFEEKPPSFVFSDTIPYDSITNSVAADPIVDDVVSINELPTEPRYSIDGVKSPMSVETSYVSVPEVTETVNLLRKDKPEMEETGIAELTMTPEEDTDKSESPAKNEKTGEQPVIERHRSQTFVVKRPNSNPTLLISSPLEEDKDARNKRLSGLTTAAEFSSQTADGPSEKIRRRENGSLVEETLIPTAGKEENATELIGIGNSWGNKDFVNSTAIGDDITRQFVRRDVEDTSIMLTYPLSEELPSRIIQIDGQTSNLRPGVKVTEDTMEISVPKSPFAALKQRIESLAKSTIQEVIQKSPKWVPNVVLEAIHKLSSAIHKLSFRTIVNLWITSKATFRAETIWNINRFDEKIIAFNFFSKSIVLAIYLNDDLNSTNPIKVIGFLSQLVEEDNDPGTCLAHHLIMKKVNSASLTHSYQTYEDVPRLLDHVTAEVKLGMDFMFELERLRNRTVMDIQGNRITFLARSRDINAGIILKITMRIKPFEDISSNDITVAYLLGGEKVRQNDIKGLITNVKRDHRFLRFYINDVRDYIDLMAVTGCSI